MTIPKYLFSEDTITEINIDPSAMSEITKHELEVERLTRMIRVQEKAVERAKDHRRYGFELEILEALKAELKQLEG